MHLLKIFGGCFFIKKKRPRSIKLAGAQTLREKLFGITCKNGGNQKERRRPPDLTSSRLFNPKKPNL